MSKFEGQSGFGSGDLYGGHGSNSNRSSAFEGTSLFDAASTSEAAVLAAAKVCVRCSVLQSVVVWCSAM